MHRFEGGRRGPHRNAPPRDPQGPTATSHSAGAPYGAELKVARAVAVAGAAAAALAVWAIAVPLLGVELQVVPGSDQPGAVGAAHVAISALLAGLAGWGSLALLERVTARARRIWTVLGIVVLAASLAGPQAGVSTAATVTLAAMHLAVGGVLIPALVHTSPPAAAR